MFNHCRAEGSMTSKTALIATLAENQNFWANWLTNKEGEAEISIPGFDKHGVDSFFPKSFVVTNIQDQCLFFEEMVLNSCEAYLKIYIKAFEKQDKFRNTQGVFVREKLVVVCNLI